MSEDKNLKAENCWQFEKNTAPGEMEVNNQTVGAIKDWSAMAKGDVMSMT